MRTAIFQLIIIEDVVKVEFKITTPDGFSKLVERMIETEADYDDFKRDVRLNIATLDDMIKQAINPSCAKATEDNVNNNGHKGDHASDLPPVEHKSVAV